MLGACGPTRYGSEPPWAERYTGKVTVGSVTGFVASTALDTHHRPDDVSALTLRDRMQFVLFDSCSTVLYGDFINHKVCCAMRRLLLTLIVGASVSVLPRLHDASPVYSIRSWPSYAIRTAARRPSWIVRKG